MRALLVILNKDNAESLDKCLSSIEKMDGLCQDFDVLILDGASKDNSKEIAEKYTKKWDCIKFKIQEKLGGTGFARREACQYAMKNGYDAVVWGDSENIYTERYMKSMIEKLKDNDAVGGVPRVKGGFYAHAFSWYHALHLVIPGLYKRHIPGNNKGEKVEIYKKVEYPDSIRSEDYGFSLLLLKKGIELKQDIAEDAVVYVSLPEKWREVKAWQRARAKGVAQVLRKIGFFPWDNIAWSLIFLLFLILLPIFIISPWPLIIYTLLFSLAAIGLFFKSKEYIERPKNRFFFAPIFGLLVYSIYSLLAIFYYASMRK